MGLGDILELGVAVACLRDALFSERTHLFGYLERNDRGGIGGVSHGIYPLRVLGPPRAFKAGARPGGSVGLGMPFVGQRTYCRTFMAFLCNVFSSGHNLTCPKFGTLAVPLSLSAWRRPSRRG